MSEHVEMSGAPGPETERHRGRRDALQRAPTVVLCLALALLGACGHVWTLPTDAPIPSAAAIAPSPTPPAPTDTPRPPQPVWLPTRTPAPTPTPVIYVVQKGDTLIGIARQFGVSATVLQTANGIVDPRRLQIGQELLIPPPEQGAAPVLPTPTPVAVRVERLGAHALPTGGFCVLGEVVNPLPQAVERVAVEVTLLDGAGGVLAQEQAATLLEVLPAGESAAFAVLFPDAPTLANYRVAVVSADVLQHLGHLYLDFGVPSHELRTARNGSVEVAGTVRNEGAAIARPFAVVTCYDADGLPVAVREVPTDPPVLGPGEQGEFRVSLTPLGAAVDRCRVQAQGESLGE